MTEQPVETLAPQILFLHLGPKAYLIDQYAHVLSALIAKGANIDVWCRFQEPQDKLLKIMPELTPAVRKLHFPLEKILKHSASERFLVQCLVWLICKIAHPFKKYDTIICDNDWEALSYTAGLRTKLYTIQLTLDLFSVGHLIAGRHPGCGPQSFREKIDYTIDKILGGKLLPKWHGRNLTYSPERLYADLFFNLYPQPLIKKGLGSSHRLFVAGEKYKENYIMIGTPENRLHITGLVAHDNALHIAAHLQKDEQIQFLDTHHIAGDKIISFFTSFKKPQNHGQRENTFLIETAEICKILKKHYPDHSLILTAHPHYSPKTQSLAEDLSLYIDQKSLPKVIEGNFNLSENIKLMLCSELVIAPGTLGLIGALIGKDVITYGKNAPQWTKIYNIFRHAFLLKQDNLEQEIGEFKIWRNQEKARLQLFKNYFSTDGQAADRIAEIIIDENERTQ